MNNKTIEIPKNLIYETCHQIRWIEELVDGDDYTDREKYSSEEILEMIREELDRNLMVSSLEPHLLTKEVSWFNKESNPYEEVL